MSQLLASIARYHFRVVQSATILHGTVVCAAIVTQPGEKTPRNHLFLQKTVEEAWMLRIPMFVGTSLYHW